MKTKLLIAGLASTLLALGAGVAHAGTHSRAEVSINGSSSQARGVPSHARESRDQNQYIGCTVSQRGSYGPQVSCFARDASGRSLTCRNSPWGSTYTTHQAEVVSAIRADSHIMFEVYRGQCTEIVVNNSSVYLDGPATVASTPIYERVSR